MGGDEVSTFGCPTGRNTCFTWFVLPARGLVVPLTRLVMNATGLPPEEKLYGSVGVGLTLCGCGALGLIGIPFGCAIGTIGAIGAMGAIGAIGAMFTGAMGAMGAIGAIGSIGAIGATGAIGAVGAMGAIGATSANAPQTAPRVATMTIRILAFISLLRVWATIATQLWLCLPVWAISFLVFKSFLHFSLDAPSRQLRSCRPGIHLRRSGIHEGRPGIHEGQREIHEGSSKTREGLPEG